MKTPPDLPRSDFGRLLPEGRKKGEEGLRTVYN